MAVGERWCRGRDSNPHGAFAPEDFKSFWYYRKYLILLGLISKNVKMCKFMCKGLKIAPNSMHFRGS